MIIYNIKIDLDKAGVIHTPFNLTSIILLCCESYNSSFWVPGEV